MKNYPIPCALIGALVMAGSASAATNLVVNGSFEGTTGVPPSGWSLGGIVSDHADPVAIQYGQSSAFPFGGQGEVVPTDNAISLSPLSAMKQGTYHCSRSCT